MPLIFIAGISTAGKSRVAEELSNLGYEAYDAEHNGVSAWYNKGSGKRIAELGQMPERTAQWLDDHHWLISIGWLKKIEQRSKNKIIFICGGGANEAEVIKIADIIFWLKTDEKTIRTRVKNDRDHDYGTKEHELERIIKANKSAEAKYANLDAIMIDATQPIKVVTEEIIRQTSI